MVDTDDPSKVLPAVRFFTMKSGAAPKERWIQGFSGLSKRFADYFVKCLMIHFYDFLMKRMRVRVEVTVRVMVRDL